MVGLSSSLARASIDRRRPDGAEEKVGGGYSSLGPGVQERLHLDVFHELSQLSLELDRLFHEAGTWLHDES